MFDTDDNELKKGNIISSGNPELDSKIAGGIPVGSLTLIEGGSGSGKSVLSQQLIWGALTSGVTVAAFTSENTVKSLVSQMQSIDLDILDYLLLGKLRVYPMELSHLGANAPHILARIVRNEQKRDMLVIDSFTSAITSSCTVGQIISFVEEVKRLTSNGMTILLTLHVDAVDPDLVSPIRSMCDVNLQLHAEQDGQRIVKTLQVVKVRGGSSTTGAIIGFDVEPGWGMRIIPISKARG